MKPKVKVPFVPVMAFVSTYVIHFVWRGLFPETDPAQSKWVLVPVEKSWWDLYVETGSYWLGYSYALSIAFVAMATQRYLLTQCLASGKMAICGVTMTGGLAVFGCFLLGCCGSPMLIVWINLFGAGFLPVAKPLIALLTSLSILVAWVWMYLRHR